MDIKFSQSRQTPFVNLGGAFYRAINADHLDHILLGSTQPGRYSEKNQKTLYLSAPQQGVAAAMISHQNPASPKKMVVKLRVNASNILDLRDNNACAILKINPDDAFGPWQETVQNGKIPASQILANRLRDLGAHGLIDPSRQAAGLWHLVLFNWNKNGQPGVTVTNTLPRPQTLL